MKTRTVALAGLAAGAAIAGGVLHNGGPESSPVTQGITHAATPTAETATDRAIDRMASEIGGIVLHAEHSINPQANKLVVQTSSIDGKMKYTIKAVVPKATNGTPDVAHPETLEVTSTEGVPGIGKHTNKVTLIKSGGHWDAKDEVRDVINGQHINSEMPESEKTPAAIKSLGGRAVTMANQLQKSQAHTDEEPEIQQDFSAAATNVATELSHTLGVIESDDPDHPDGVMLRKEVRYSRDNGKETVVDITTTHMKRSDKGTPDLSTVYEADLLETSADSSHPGQARIHHINIIKSADPSGSEMWSAQDFASIHTGESETPLEQYDSAKVQLDSPQDREAARKHAEKTQHSATAIAMRTHTQATKHR